MLSCIFFLTLLLPIVGEYPWRNVSNSLGKANISHLSRNELLGRELYCFYGHELCIKIEITPDLSPHTASWCSVRPQFHGKTKDKADIGDNLDFLSRLSRRSPVLTDETRSFWVRYDVGESAYLMLNSIIPFSHFNKSLIISPDMTAVTTMSVWAVPVVLWECYSKVRQLSNDLVTASPQIGRNTRGEIKKSGEWEVTGSEKLRGVRSDLNLVLRLST